MIDDWQGGHGMKADVAAGTVDPSNAPSKDKDRWAQMSFSATTLFLPLSLAL